MQEWICKNEDETVICAKEIAKSINYPSVLCLHGNLGAGKTSFSRAFIRELINNPDEIIPSPTYNIVQTYDDEQIWHFDLYRLNHPDELYDIGWEEAITSKLCLIEWPDRLGSLKPANAINITIDILENETRKIILNS